MSNNRPKRKRGCCSKLRNKHKYEIDNLRIIRRHTFMGKREYDDGHIHVIIVLGDIGAWLRVVPKFFVGVVFIGIAIALFVAGRDIHELATDVAVLAVVMSVMVTTYVPSVTNSRPHYSELLLSLSQVTAVKTKDDQRQWLINAVLQLYNLDGCSREDFLKFLKWINHEQRSCEEFIDLADNLTKLLCKDM